MTKTSQNEICIPSSAEIKDSPASPESDELKTNEEELSPEEIAMQEVLDAVNQRFAFYMQKGIDPLTTVLNVSKELDTYLKEDSPNKNDFHNEAAKTIINTLIGVRWELIDQNQHYR